MAFDRGYFGHPHQPEFSPESPYKILLTHSYGLHLCPTHQQQQAHLWVIFAGFQSFHPPEPKAKRYSQRVLQRMLQQLERDPRSVLHQFYCNTYAPIPYGPISWQSHASAIPDWLLAWPIEPWQIEPLRQDLKHLNQVDRGLTGDALPERILIFHGTADQIVDKGQGQRLVQQVQQMQLSNNPVTFSKISGAGHGLPFTHLADCWAIVHAFLPPAQRC
jgi:pimeloyl-[acyl-carrier protein] methyl ester esterase